MVKFSGRTIFTLHVLATAAGCYWICFLILVSLHSSSYSSKWHALGAFSASTTVLNMLSWSSTVELPALSQDGSELILSSVLERSTRSHNLYITSFFLAKSTLDPREHNEQLSVLGIAPNAVEKIHTLVNKQAKLTYNPNGARTRDVSYFCKVKLDHRSATTSVLIPASFLPNRLTSDFQSNRKLDILRCPLERLLNSSPFSSTAFQKEFITYPHNDKRLEVTLYREDMLLTSFLIPWQTRRTGYLFSSPTSASQLQVWKGLAGVTLPSPPAKSNNDPIDTIHLCVANSQKRSLHHLVEFIEHHKLIGVQHVYYSTPFTWQSTSMQQFLRSVEDYIRDGLLTVQSSADQQQASSLPLSATEGIFWSPSTERVMQINSCLYLAKGNAMYIGIWDLDDFFIPSSPRTSLAQVLQGRAAAPRFRQQKSIRAYLLESIVHVLLATLLLKLGMRTPTLLLQQLSHKMT